LFDPLTGRRHVDKLHGSDYANMKELRFEAMNTNGGLFSRSILRRSQSYWLPAARPGISEKKFYKALIAKADARFERHLARVKAEIKTGSKGRKKWRLYRTN
jgi:hypothetical protein